MTYAKAISLILPKRIDVGSLERNLRSVETCFAQAHSCTQASTSCSDYDSIISMVYNSVASFCRIQPLTDSTDRAYVATTTEQTPSSIRC